MKFRLRAIENEEYGELGWLDRRVTNRDIFEPISWHYGIAHDCLEHMAFDSVADEIEAHAAMYWIRYESGWRGQYGGSLSTKSFGEEWTNIMRGMFNNCYLPDAPKTRKLDDEIELDITAIIAEGKISVAEEFGDDNNLDRPTLDLLQSLENVFRAFFRRGYRKTAQRYKGSERFQVSHVYDQLARVMEHEKPEFEGQEIEIDVNIQNSEIRVRRLEMED